MDAIDNAPFEKIIEWAYIASDIMVRYHGADPKIVALKLEQLLFGANLDSEINILIRSK